MSAAIPSGGAFLWLVLLAGALTSCDSGGAGQTLPSPAPEHSRLPHLATDAIGRPVLSWVQSTAGANQLVYAVLDESGWRDPVTVAHGSDWMLNWADFPSVEPLDEKLWAAHWLTVQEGGMYAYDIALSLSRDGGRTWDPPVRPHRDGTPTEHGFVSMWPTRLPDGATGVGIVWLDGRHMVLDPSRSAGDDPRTVLRSATFDASGEMIAEDEVDDRVCDCCRTAAVLTPAGPLVAYRNRTEGEIRDIHVAAGGAPSFDGSEASAAGAIGWRDLGAVADDGWVIDGCPVNGPALAAQDGSIAVAWHTEAGGEPRVQVARRGPGDAAWSAPTVVDAGSVLGRVGVALLADGDAAVSWVGQAAEGSAWILLARVDQSGAAGAPLRVAAVQASRPSGVPQLVRYGDALVMAWTEWHDSVPRVVTARVPAAALPGH